MAARVIGKDPLDNIAIWHSLRDQAWWYGYNGGIASYAVAAIDIALWDIKGKLLGVPVVQLLGGAVHEKLPAVASSHAHYEDIDVTLPGPEYGTTWGVVVDTAAGEVIQLSTGPGLVAAEPPTAAGGGTHTVPARSLLVLQRLSA